MSSHRASIFGSFRGRLAFIGKSVLGKFKVDFRSSGTPWFSRQLVCDLGKKVASYAFIICSAEILVHSAVCTDARLYSQGSSDVKYPNQTTQWALPHLRIGMQSYTFSRN